MQSALHTVSTPQMLLPFSWAYLHDSLKLWVRRGPPPRGQRGLPSGPTFRGLLPGRDLLQLDEVLAEVVFLPLFVTQALQKGCRGGVGGQEGKSRQAGRGAVLGASPTPPHTSLPPSRGLSGALTSSTDANQPSKSILPTCSRGGGTEQGATPPGVLESRGPQNMPPCPLCSGGETEAQGGEGHLSGTTDLSSEFTFATFQLRPQR